MRREHGLCPVPQVWYQLPLGHRLLWLQVECLVPCGKSLLSEVTPGSRRVSTGRFRARFAMASRGGSGGRSSGGGCLLPRLFFVMMLVGLGEPTCWPGSIHIPGQ